MIGRLVSSLIAIVVGVALFPVISDSVSGVNATGAEASLLNVVPTLYLVAVVIAAVAILELDQLGGGGGGRRF